MTKKEIVQLRAKYPELLSRAIAIEDAARPGFRTVKGLGRTFSWRDYLAKNPELSRHARSATCRAVVTMGSMGSEVCPCHVA